LTSCGPVSFSRSTVLHGVVVVVVFLGFRDKPRTYHSVAGLLYRPIWTFQVRPLNASAPADVSRTPCLRTPVAEAGTLWVGK
jgi:hypothetical protein